ncbi:DUF4249 domain-containing protein [Reichenbachiella ulvae]|uniref:DUF4249 domain-containing protein n=1 Tax=Reichenbachiella ulvae TaxID=2980104 RepID=A0ABT3CY78_9BACT|nr:DUF4249 domain-containing protein [Reichenbachiella ulvae]MCV9388656.1 DUF4249 domain-containing protein [Reichenbachiella ulvae]
MKRFLTIILILSGCIEPFEFSRNNEDPQLVVEAFVSDLSYTESLDAPSNGRYFTVKLKVTRPVGPTIQNRVAPFADIKLIDDMDNVWSYVENFNDWGTYVLLDKAFKARIDRSYKLQITMRDGLIYESDWEKLPNTESCEIEDIWFNEDERKVYEYPAGKQTIVDQKIINVSSSIPINSERDTRYMKWVYAPMWIYEAPLASGPYSDYKTCWITNDLYLNDYALQEDAVGGFDKVLFTMQTEKNNRIYKNFSVLIYQQYISKDYFYFWKLMKEQSDPNGIFDAPPANLPSNLVCVNDPSKKPIGYFGVVKEKAKRWYFHKGELSYYIEDDLRKECLVKYNRPDDPPDYAPECLSCLAYTKGEATLNRPSWWIDN